jgi:hypothetical protein
VESSSKEGRFIPHRLLALNSGQSGSAQSGVRRIISAQATV